MLDAYIIEKIRRERERRESERIPLHIEVPRPPPIPEDGRHMPGDDDPRKDRGPVIIDFGL